MQLSVKLILFVATLAVVKAYSYDHNSQALWNDLNAECHLGQQSPIELSSFHSFRLTDLGPIHFHNFDVTFQTPAEMVNNGHTADITVPKDNNAFISGGPLGFDDYITEAIHFHWGSSDKQGSEHVVNNRRFSMEMHIVHRNRKYKSVDEATRNTDGLAVLGVFFDVDPAQINDFVGLNNIVLALDDIKMYQNSTMVKDLNLAALISGINLGDFFFYQGSLTTPPCSRAVTWLLTTQKINISAKQMNSFRLLTDSSGNQLVNNYRFLQPKGMTPVYLRLQMDSAN